MKITRNGAGKGIFPELRGNIAALRWPCFAEVKYDGEACLIGYHGKNAFTRIFTSNKYGTMRTDWHKLDIIQDLLDNNDVEQTVFLAELYHGDGKAGSLYKLLENKDSDDLSLAIFDIGSIKYTNGKEMQGELTPLVTRREILGDLFLSNPDYLARIHVVEGRLDAESYFGDVTDEGYEGIVLKPMDGFLTNGPCSWVKLKKKDTTEYEVAEIDQTKERIEINVPTGRPVPLGIEVVRVGVKVTNKFKKNLKVGDMVEIEHQGVLDSGSLRHPVFLRKVERKGE